MPKRIQIPKKATKATMPRKPRGKKVVIRGLLEDKRPVQGPSLVTPSAAESRSLNPERQYKKKPSRKVQGQVRGLLEDKRLPRGPSIVTPTAEDSRALNPERTYGGKKPKGRYGPEVDPRIEISRLAEEAKAKELASRMAENERRFAAIQAADLEKARGRNTAGKSAAAALRARTRADAIAASRGPNAESGPDQGPGPMQQRDYLPGNLNPRFEQTFAQKMRPNMVTGGLAALAGLGVGRAVDAYRTNQELEDVRFDAEREERESVLAGLINQSKEQALKESIQANLARVQQQSPFLYNQVAAGRVLPQGAVVLGGRTRQDLLQELGRSMSEGQFSQ
jgi:hypothetical protein